jgi:hypothetical protein
VQLGFHFISTDRERIAFLATGPQLYCRGVIVIDGSECFERRCGTGWVTVESVAALQDETRLDGACPPMPWIYLARQKPAARAALKISEPGSLL